MEISSASDDSIPYVETDPSGRYGRVSKAFTLSYLIGYFLF